MRNRIAALLCALVLLAGVPLALSAQITSSTSSVTYGLFGTDVDNAYDVNYFSDFKGKSIGILDVRDTTRLTFGYAAKLDKLYIGGAYQGKVLDLGSSDTRSYDTYELVDSTYNLLGTRQLSTITAYSDNSNENRLGVIVGIGKIGIGASLYESVSLNTSNHSFTPAAGFMLSKTSVSFMNESNTTTPATTGTKTDVVSYTPVTTGSTYWNPAISAGMVLELGGMVLRPYLNISGAIGSTTDAAKQVTYTQVAGSTLPTYNSITEVSSYTNVDFLKQASRFNTTAMLGTKLETGPWLCDVSYEFYSPFYSTSYVGTDGTTKATVAGTAYSLTYTNYTANNLYSTTTDTTNAYFTKPYSFFRHTINLSAKYTTTIADKLKLAAALTPAFLISNSSSSYYGEQVTTSVYANSLNPLSGYTQVETRTSTGDTVTESTFSVTPNIDAALQYAITDKMVFNMGADIVFEKFSTTTTTTTVPGYSTDSTVKTSNDGTVTKSYSSTIGDARTESNDVSWNLDAPVTTLSWGLAWTLVDGVVLDTVFTAGGSSFSISSFSAMLSIKQ
jgi:hypothetical protein